MMKWILSLMMMLTVAQSVACSDANFNVTVAQSEQDAGQEMDKRLYDAEFTKKLGSSVVLTRAEHIGRARAQTVLDMNSNLFQDGIKEMLQSGSWVVTIKSDIEGDDDTLANTLIAVISYGEGGANTEVEISPATGVTFQIPAGQIRIGVYLEEDGPLTGPLGSLPAPGFSLTPPVRQRVSAFIKRGAADNTIRRTFYRRITTDGEILEGPVPNFADGFLLFSRDALSGAIDTYDPANILSFASNSTIGTVPVIEYDGATLLTAMQNNKPLRIPSTASLWRWTQNVGSSAGTFMAFEFYQPF